MFVTDRVVQLGFLRASAPFPYWGETRSLPSLYGEAVPCHPLVCGQKGAEIRANVRACHSPDTPLLFEWLGRTTQSDHGQLFSSGSLLAMVFAA